ncbi:response regulator RpfG family c-di-GMP phosphodiesterase [Pseudomonas duriflava]|uniref:Response regulator RpfG family c-di-GMP phosphodiesterase n=1 Tax=Pseudomonas duriflava TaxID=459528 RepID=A0A562QR41_9PSED|nr:HD domain-containing phosphohydrolase [Pseudomonas duriflava]TWI58670.1 response regulator RpfG family c-di-GMP phosphodiesterase [Pseudomonas duriflava]
MMNESVATLLLVDDEPNILSSLRRVLRNEPYQLLTASGGEEAIALLESHSVDLILSDARMPGMDGATLLSQVQKQWPSCLRILLTGYADITTTVRAINEGQIYRYISKPWDDDELRTILRQALAYQHSERERVRLEQLTQEQNTRLQELNNTLEQRVRSRTAELQQTADMLDLAYAELKRSYVTATEVFANLVNLRLSKARQTNTQVIALVKAYAEHVELDELAVNDLSMAAALYNIGKLTWDDRLLNCPSDQLYKEDKVRFCQYPVVGESLLMALEPVQDAARIIRHHQERWSGSGFPDRLKGEAIPFGSRLLKLAVDFIELQRGMILDRRLSRDEALLLIEKYSGRFYDPDLCTRFIELCTTLAPDLALADASILALDTRKLEPGMTLARSLHAQNGMLLLNEGKQLTKILIDKLIAFEASEGGRYTIFVRKPDQSEQPQGDAR